MIKILIYMKINVAIECIKKAKYNLRTPRERIKIKSKTKP